MLCRLVWSYTYAKISLIMHLSGSFRIFKPFLCMFSFSLFSRVKQSTQSNTLKYPFKFIF